MDEFQGDPNIMHVSRKRKEYFVGAEKVPTKRTHRLSVTDDAKFQGDHASNNPSRRGKRLGMEVSAKQECMFELMGHEQGHDPEVARASTVVPEFSATSVNRDRCIPSSVKKKLKQKLEKIGESSVLTGTSLRKKSEFDNSPRRGDQRM